MAVEALSGLRGFLAVPLVVRTLLDRPGAAAAFAIAHAAVAGAIAAMVAARRRDKTVGRRVFVVLAVLYAPGAWVLSRLLPASAFAVAHACCLFHHASYGLPAVAHSAAFRALAGVPGHAALVASVAAALAGALPVRVPGGAVLAAAAAAVAVAQWQAFAVGGAAPLEQVTVRVRAADDTAAGRPSYLGEGTPGHDSGSDSIRVVQLADPHVGVHMTAARLRAWCERAAEARPDLLLLTGDMVAVETPRDERLGELLRWALEPLRGAVQPGRAFAVLGNHDYGDALAHVRAALASAGVRLLQHESAVVEVNGREVEVVGCRYVWRYSEKARYLERRVSADFPAPPGGRRVRVLLLHDPVGFERLDAGAGFVVFSGHVHGGMVGFRSWSVARLYYTGYVRGWWSCGSNRLYVHRGNGQHAFPFRLGVGPENSVVTLRLG